MGAAFAGIVRAPMTSVIMTPLKLASPYGADVVIYIDNAMIHDHYTLGDLDYLMLVAMHTAAVLKRFVT